MTSTRRPGRRGGESRDVPADAHERSDTMKSDKDIPEPAEWYRIMVRLNEATGGRYVLPPSHAARTWSL